MAVQRPVHNKMHWGFALCCVSHALTLVTMQCDPRIDLDIYISLHALHCVLCSGHKIWLRQLECTMFAGHKCNAMQHNTRSSVKKLIIVNQPLYAFPKKYLLHNWLCSLAPPTFLQRERGGLGGRVLSSSFILLCWCEK